MKLERYQIKLAALQEKIADSEKRLVAARGAYKVRSAKALEQRLLQLQKELTRLQDKVVEVAKRPPSKCARIDELLLEGKDLTQVLEIIIHEFQITDPEKQAATSRTIRCRPWHIRNAGKSVPVSAAA